MNRKELPRCQVRVKKIKISSEYSHHLPDEYYICDAPATALWGGKTYVCERHDEWMKKKQGVKDESA